MSAAAGTVVDSSVLLDLFTEDRTWLTWSQARLVEAAERGALVLNAVVIAEIAPRFSRVEALREALSRMCLIEEIPLAATSPARHSAPRDTGQAPSGRRAGRCVRFRLRGQALAPNGCRETRAIRSGRQLRDIAVLVRREHAP